MSIQGEQLQREPIPLATDGDVDAYVDGASPGVLACRARGRHLFDPPDKARLVFDDITDDDLLVRHVQCRSCGLAWFRELWGTVGRGRNQRVEFIDGRLEYRPDPQTGERYQSPPGRGRMTPRQVRGSMATAALAGQSIAKIKAQLRAQRQR